MPKRIAATRRRMRVSGGGAGRVRRPSACTSIAGILPHCREPPLGAISGHSPLDLSPKQGTAKIGTFETSDRHEQVFRLTNRLRALTIGAQEAAAHPFPVAEAGVEGDRLDRQT